jgi:hypothetical protein
MERRNRKHQRRENRRAATNRQYGRPHGKHQRRHQGKGRKFYREILQRADLFEKFKPLEEDILKYIFEADQKKVDISRLTQVFRYVNGDIERIIQNLISEKYVILNENFLLLTPAGEEIAELIFRIHNEIED